MSADKIITHDGIDYQMLTGEPDELFAEAQNGDIVTIKRSDGMFEEAMRGLLKKRSKKQFDCAGEETWALWGSDDYQRGVGVALSEVKDRFHPVEIYRPIGEHEPTKLEQLQQLVGDEEIDNIPIGVLMRLIMQDEQTKRDKQQSMQEEHD